MRERSFIDHGHHLSHLSRYLREGFSISFSAWLLHSPAFPWEIHFMANKA